MPTLPERALLVKLFYQNNGNGAAALRGYRRQKGLRRGPMSLRALRDMMTKFERTGLLTVLPGRGRRRTSTARVEEVATAVVEAASESSIGSVSVPALSRTVDLPYSTVWHVMRRVLGYYPYRIRRAHQLLPGDADTRVSFALQFLARMEVDVDWPWNILWSDEAHFGLNGQVNAHNCRIWATENPHALHEVPLHAGRVTVWCGFTATFLIGPYFFEEMTPTGIRTCTVTGQRYCDMLTGFVIPELQRRRRIRDTVFMQDGAPPHIARPVQRVLRRTFTDERVISRYFPTVWPPRSPDLTPCDFWLWGFLKHQVYRENPATLPQLKDSIRRHVLGIHADQLRSAVEHTVLRMEGMIGAQGGHIEHM